MIKAEESGSLYDFIGNNHEAPQPQGRTVNQFANRPDMSKPYVNKAPNHSAHYERKEQLNDSKNAYWRMFSGQMPKGEFEQNVNTRFGGKLAIGADYRGKMPEYITIYKKMLIDWNNE